ncbi:hypothetical protein I8751_14220 [Nostocaceae cyanobacterium CENA357]|uniref:Uncharacterized protein n=1 Tax=Atlanticothrix silvestris CENA357 TaxID=1725252 RepID=A0A8J7L1K0_9CYAN|nr:hypothetical protein [Atlanticothrix silvestris]MBH8553505.1 hypothetical protein [Atlanticothrix silvestris CENA357]
MSSERSHFWCWGDVGDRTFDDGVDLGDRSLSNCLKEAIALLMMGLMWAMSTKSLSTHEEQ